MSEPLESLLRCKTCNTLHKILKRYNFKIETIMVNGGNAPKTMPTSIEKEVYVCSKSCADLEFQKATRGCWQGQKPRKEKESQPTE